MRTLTLLLILSLGACGDGEAPYDYSLETMEYDGYLGRNIHLVLRYDQSISGEVVGTGMSTLATNGDAGDDSPHSLIHLRDVLEDGRSFSAYWYLDVDEDDACTDADFAWNRDHSPPESDFLDLHRFRESRSDILFCDAFDGAAPL